MLGSLLPADITVKEFEYLLGLYPEKEGLKPNPDFKLYKTPPGTGEVTLTGNLVW